VSKSARPPRSAVVTWAVLLGAVLAMLVFAQIYGEQQRAREVRSIAFANTRLPAGQLRDCLTNRMPLTEAGWARLDGLPPRMVRWNTARGLRITVSDGAAVRRVEIATLGARPLRDQEAEALRRCLAGD